MQKGLSQNHIVDETLKALKRNRFRAVYVENRKKALQSIMEEIPSNATIGVGDSLTLKEIGVFEELKHRGFTLFWPFDEKVAKENRRAVMRKALLADIFLSSSNAVTVDGKIVNVDATGNRVAGLVFGPRKAIVVVGVNKIVKNVEEALERIKTIAAPLNAKRIREERGWELLPCVETGKCVDCSAENRICNITAIIEKKPRAIDLLVIIIGENLGL
ncbi:lactate utilization protein [Candidatus Bathyarchaeota archaeon]|nr:lactate utilization protein [Candidatus Bathyarchaeota archaeon]